MSIDERVLDIVEAILGDENIEIFGKGQVLLKEKDGGHAKIPHQVNIFRWKKWEQKVVEDAAYFEFRDYGPIGTVDTNQEKNNGTLRVWPGTHKRGYLEHVDTESHVALPHVNT